MTITRAVCFLFSIKFVCYCSLLYAVVGSQLLPAVVPLNAFNQAGFTPLMVAARSGNVGDVQRLIALGADSAIHALGANDKRTALHFALENGDNRQCAVVADLLIRSRADLYVVNARLDMPIHALATVTNLDSRMRLLASLMYHGADINALNGNKDTLLHLLVKAKNEYGVVALRDEWGLEIDFSVKNKQGLTARALALEQGLTGIADQLLQKPKMLGVGTYSKSGLTYLLHAVIASNAALVTDLIKNRTVQMEQPSQDLFGYTPLHVAVLRGDLSLVKQLLSLKASFKTFDKEGKGPFHLLTYPHDLSRRVQLLELFIASGADIMMPDRQGDTLLHACVIFNDKQLLAHILKTYPTKVNIRIKNQAYSTPHDLAVKLGRLDIARMLT